MGGRNTELQDSGEHKVSAGEWSGTEQVGFPDLFHIPATRIPASSRIPSPACNLLGVRIDLVTYETLCRAVLQWRDAGETHYCCFTNPHSIILSLDDEEMRRATNGATLTLADGVGVAMAAWCLGYKHSTRLTGPAAMLKLIEFGIPHGLRHYFFGGADGVAERLAAKLQQTHPGLVIAGTQCPPFQDVSDAETRRSIDRINQTQPDVLWVALGTLKQEKWMYRNRSRLRAHAILGVGAAFDFHSGNIPWAPKWIRTLGLEWAYRLAHEPRRLLPRNINNCIFVWKLALEIARRRPSPIPSTPPAQPQPRTNVPAPAPLPRRPR
jgi:N-acetylglucosaminyldiphosphoundecaprenol N-acetyl-beta-D-mannosaminyltransferase